MLGTETMTVGGITLTNQNFGEGSPFFDFVRTTHVRLSSGCDRTFLWLRFQRLYRHHRTRFPWIDHRERRSSMIFWSALLLTHLFIVRQAHIH